MHFEVVQGSGRCRFSYYANLVQNLEFHNVSSDCCTSYWNLHGALDRVYLRAGIGHVGIYLQFCIFKNMFDTHLTYNETVAATHR